MVAFFLLPCVVAGQREFYQAGFLAPSYGNTYAAGVPQMYAAAAPEMYAPAQYAYPEAYPVYEQESASNGEWSDVAMLAVAGAIVGAAIGYNTKKTRKVSACGNPNCTCANCACGAGL